MTNSDTSKTLFKDMTDAQRAEAMKHAAGRLQAELQANAREISQVLEAGYKPCGCPEYRNTDHGAQVNSCNC